MRRRTLRLAALLLTFYVGASLDFYVRESASDSDTTDCLCMRIQCRVLLVADHPLLALSHPLETLDLLRTASRHH